MSTVGSFFKERRLKVDYCGIVKEKTNNMRDPLIQRESFMGKVSLFLFRNIKAKRWNL